MIALFMSYPICSLLFSFAYDYIKYTLNGEFDKLEASLMKR